MYDLYTSQMLKILIIMKYLCVASSKSQKHKHNDHQIKINGYDTDDEYI